MEVRRRSPSGVDILDLSGRLDADEMREALEVFKTESACHVLVNLAQVDWITSTHLGVLMVSSRFLRENHGSMGLVVTGPLMEIFKITSVGPVWFGVFETEDEAISYFEKHGTLQR